jgi:hypothetical protein
MFLDAELLDAKAPFLGSKQMHHDLDSAGALTQLHAVVYVHQVADRELEIRRDRNSNRVLRDAFFDVARRDGVGTAFPRTAPFDDVKLGHRAFVAHRFPQVVALADLRYGGPDVPGSLWRTPRRPGCLLAPASTPGAGRWRVACSRLAARVIAPRGRRFRTKGSS